MVLSSFEGLSAGELVTHSTMWSSTPRTSYWLEGVAVHAGGTQVITDLVAACAPHGAGFKQWSDLGDLSPSGAAALVDLLRNGWVEKSQQEPISYRLTEAAVPLLKIYREHTLDCLLFEPRAIPLADQTTYELLMFLEHAGWTHTLLGASICAQGGRS